MKKHIFTNFGRLGISLALFAAVLLLPQAGFAASTGTTPILQQNGGGCVLQDGDYVTESGWIHQYFIEVPSGLASLRVQLFDRDIAGNHDFLAGTWDTSCVYTLYNPSGTSVATYTAPNDSTSGDNVWRTLGSTIASPTNGHWRLVVDMTGTAGDETNAYGIRADDGNAGTGGTELNIYAYSFVPLGRMSSTLYPWVTRGCTVGYNDFDGDATNTISYSSRTGTVSGSYSGSVNNVWLNSPISFANDFYSGEAGLWSATNGLSGSNINNFYAGDFSAANPPPSSQPEGNTFRIYLQRDGGGKPDKPVFSQKISFISGSNPPAVGSTSRIRVELIIFNPAAQAITFSAANPVTAYVPGGGVVYAGNPVASQGTYTTPAIGGTGAVTWNPGPVAGNNSYATLYYEINVTPPNNNRLPVTGTPAANGSTARYVDETGNTTQAAATYTYGPLCELAVTAGGPDIPTWVAVTYFEADMSSGQPGVEWHTTAENGTAGFYLWRQDRESKEFRLVSPEFLPALANAMAGGVYRLADPGVPYGETAVYQLEEINVRGESQYYGPFTVNFDSDPPARRQGGNIYEKGSREVPTHINGFQKAVFTASEYENNRQQLRRAGLRLPRATTASQGGGQVRIAVRNRGLVHVSAASIAAALNMSLVQVGELIAARSLSLTSQAEPVAWLAGENNNGIYFYGEKLESPYSDENVYWLERGLGLVMETVSGGNAGPAASSQTFNQSAQYEEDRMPLTSLFFGAEDDFWLWDFVEAGAEVKVFPMWVASPAASGSALLTVHLQGASDSEVFNEHHARFYLNDNLIGESWWDGTNAHTCQFQFNQSILIDGKNTFVVSGIRDGGVKYSHFYLDSIDLSYQRHYRIDNNVLWCRGDGNQTISVYGFNDAQALVLDISRPRQPKLVSTTGIDAAGRLTFVPADPTNSYLVSGLSAVAQPFSVSRGSTADLKRNFYASEYLLIAPEEFAAEAEQLAEYRRSQGLAAKVVTLEDIYASFNYGLASPLAIKEFINYARPKMSSQELKYVVLVGRGTFDYKNHLGADDNLVPVILAGTPDGLFAADNLYGDVEGYDGIPEIAVSRLPVVSVAELRTLISKIKTYDRSQGPWTEKAFLIADNADGGGDFFATSEALGSQMVGYALERFTLAGQSNASLLRSEIIAGFNRGAALVNYVGHAGLNQLTQENIFNISDLQFLFNGDRLPIMVFLTCAAGRFDIPGYVCLSEAMVLKDFAGIVAALAPSSAANNSDARLLVEAFYKAAFKAKEKDLGSAWLAAARNFVAQGGKPHLLNMYNLLGDPAVMFK